MAAARESEQRTRAFIATGASAGPLARVRASGGACPVMTR